MAERKEGLGAALDVVDVGQPAGPTDDQLPLPIADARAQRAGEAAISDEPGDGAGADGAQRGPGRPKGARNKRTEAWAAYRPSRYTSPLEGLAVLVARGIRELVAELGCELIEDRP